MRAINSPSEKSVSTVVMVAASEAKGKRGR
jgi:hypothetical protein